MVEGNKEGMAGLTFSMATGPYCQVPLGRLKPTPKARDVWFLWLRR